MDGFCDFTSFLACLDKVQEELLYYPGVGIGIGGGVGVSKKFDVKVFYVMGKALSGELSCPCTGLVNSTCISVISERCAGDNGRLCSMEPDYG